MPSKAETFFGRIPVLGWTIAHAYQKQRFRPIEDAYKKLLTSRYPAEALAQWPPEQKLDAARLMAVLEEELGWSPPSFIPTDPCLVAFWAHEDGLDDLAALKRIEHEWGVELSNEEIAKIQGYDLRSFISLLRTRSQKP